MAKTKPQLLDEAKGAGIDVDALPQDGQDGPSVATLQAAIDATTGEIPVDVGTYIAQTGDQSLAVPLAGLLAAAPDLRGRELKPSEWGQQLDAYLKSERS